MGAALILNACGGKGVITAPKGSNNAATALTTPAKAAGGETQTTPPPAAGAAAAADATKTSGLVIDEKQEARAEKELRNAEMMVDARVASVAATEVADDVDVLESSAQLTVTGTTVGVYAAWKGARVAAKVAEELADSAGGSIDRNLTKALAESRTRLQQAVKKAQLGGEYIKKAKELELENQKHISRVMNSLKSWTETPGNVYTAEFRNKAVAARTKLQTSISTWNSHVGQKADAERQLNALRGKIESLEKLHRESGFDIFVKRDVLREEIERLNKDLPNKQSRFDRMSRALSESESEMSKAEKAVEALDFFKVKDGKIATFTEQLRSLKQAARIRSYSIGYARFYSTFWNSEAKLWTKLVNLQASEIFSTLTRGGANALRVAGGKVTLYGIRSVAVIAGVLQIIDLKDRIYDIQTQIDELDVESATEGVDLILIRTANPEISEEDLRSLDIAPGIGAGRD